MTNSGTLKTTQAISRYFEKVLGLSKVEAGFFAESADQNGVSAAAELESPIFPVKCWLIDFHESELPSVREMSNKLKAAVEAEWVKHGLSGRVQVQWLTGHQYKASGNVGHEMGLVIFFGEFSSSERDHEKRTSSASSVNVLVSRLDEMNLNPALKRDAWRKIQSEIARFAASSTLV